MSNNNEKSNSRVVKIGQRTYLFTKDDDGRAMIDGKTPDLFEKEDFDIPDKEFEALMFQYIYFVFG